MPRSKSVLTLVWVAIAAVVGLPSFGSPRQSGPTAGPLRVHPTNGHYFADRAGAPVYLAGWSFTGFQDVGPINPDYDLCLAYMANNNLNYLRMWVREVPKYSPFDTEVIGPMPYVRTGPGTANDGQPRFNVQQFNQAYFDRLESRVTAARDRGIYVSVMLFQAWDIENRGSDDPADNPPDPWRYHPYNTANNVNGVNGDLNGDGEGSEIETLQSSAITNLQEAYVRKVVDTVNHLDNVLYEITNEGGDYSVDWQIHMARVVKNYQGSKPRQHPVGITGGAYWPQLLAIPEADWVAGTAAAWGDPSEPWISDPPVSDRKVTVADTDHIGGSLLLGNVTLAVRWVWKTFTRGHNPSILSGVPTWLGGPPEPNPSPTDPDPDDPIFDWERKQVGFTRSYAVRMNLAEMKPRNSLSSTAYCLANPGVEYLIFQPSSAAFTVNLPAGGYSYEWFDVSTGAVASAGSISVAGGNSSFAAPFSGDSVLYLKRGGSSGGDTVPPSVQFTWPADGDVVSGSIEFVAIASDNVGVAWVDLYVDGLLVKTDFGPNYTYLWDTTLETDGPHTLTATAFDAAGNSASASIGVRVANGGGADKTSPSVRFAWPADGDTVSGSIEFVAIASDNVGVAWVDLYVDGLFVKRDFGPNYTYLWDTNLETDGPHTLTATAFDASGNSASASIGVIVWNGAGASYHTLLASPAGVAPGGTLTVNWTAPAGGTSPTDWIGLYATGAPNGSYLSWGYTAGASDGTMSFTAPGTAGTYEFRYLLNDGFVDVARSNAVTVSKTALAGVSMSRASGAGGSGGGCGATGMEAALLLGLLGTRRRRRRRGSGDDPGIVSPSQTECSPPTPRRGA